MKMNEEYIELAANYGIDVKTPDRFYETQQLLLVEIMKHLQRVDKMAYRGDNYKDVSVPDDIITEVSCNMHIDGKYSICSTHNECWMTDVDATPESCQHERTEQDDLQDVADKIEAGHEILNTHNFGNCVNCKGCDDDFFESVVEEQDKLFPKDDSTRTPPSHVDMTMANNELDKLEGEIVTRPCMKCGDPIITDLSFAECSKCRMDRVLNTPVVFSDEQLEEAEHVLNSQLFTCGDCKLHGKPDCPLDVPHAIPSWTHETCKEFERKTETKSVCFAVQFSDWMVCKACNLTWDINYPAPPCTSDCLQKLGLRE